MPPRYLVSLGLSDRWKVEGLNSSALPCLHDSVSRSSFLYGGGCKTNSTTMGMENDRPPNQRNIGGGH